MTPSQRTRSPELMDAPDVDGGELTRSLHDLQWVNRWLGGTRVALGALAPMVGQIAGEVRVLDVGTGSADIPRALTGWARRQGRRVRVVATDFHARTVEVARRQTADDADIVVEQADALSLPYADGAFHLAMCHTALHHFDRPDAVRVLAGLWRVCTRGVVVTDLMRSRAGLLGVRLLAATVWRDHPITRHDGVASIRGAFTPTELDQLAREAGLGRTRVRRHLLANRMSLVARRDLPAEAGS